MKQLVKETSRNELVANMVCNAIHFLTYELQQCNRMPYQANSYAYFMLVDDLLAARMVAYAAADIRGASQASIAFNISRSLLLTWRNIYEGAVFVNGVLDSVEIESDF